MKKITIISLLCIAMLIALDAGAQPTPAFKSGERLHYLVSYRAKMVPNSEVAEVIISTAASRLDGNDVFHVNARGRVMPFFRWFFDINDTYNCWMDATTLRPQKFTADLKEGNYRFTSTILFDWNKMEANSKYRNLKRPTAKTKTMQLSKGSYDGIALFYNLRSTPIESFVAGQPRVMPLVLDDTIKNIQYKFLGREERVIKNQGRFKTLKFVCTLTTSSGEAFEDGTELLIWISDDQNKIPLYIESPIKVGSIQASLSSFENLKYPLKSKIE